MTTLELRDRLLTAKQRFGRNEIGVNELYAAADAYIESIKEFKKRTGNKKLKVPSRSYIIRAL